MTTIRTEPMTVNIGPQHPSTHGVFRLRVTFDGEEILQVEPIFGYLHRGTEKLAEERNYTQVVTLTDRLDYVSSMINNQAYCLAVEKLLGAEVPIRGQYLRTLTAELQRIAAHLMGIGFIIQDLGALGTPLMYCFRSRERILDLFEMLCGARITVSYMRPGGVFFDAPPEFWPALDQFLVDFEEEFKELEHLLLENEIVMVRTRGVSPLPLDMAINCSVSGPVLRASGLEWDWRKGRALRRLQPSRVRCPHCHQRRQLRPVLGPHPGDQAEHPDHPAVRGADRAGASAGGGAAGTSPGAGRPKHTDGRRPPRESWPSTWSATEASAPTAARYARHPCSPDGYRALAGWVEACRHDSYARKRRHQHG